MNKVSTDSIDELAKRWPSTIVARTEITRFTGGLVSPRYLANLDCKGLGPAGALRLGNRIAYPVRNLIDWLKGRVKVEDCHASDRRERPHRAA